ncbi:MAG: SagB/ThcOx family dehydrogenase [Bryobacteraceae bacterium]
MWLHWAQEAHAVIDGADATVDVAGMTVVLPGRAALLIGLRDLLREPRPVEEIEQQLRATGSAPLVAETLRELMNSQALVPWALGPELAQLHQETVAGGAGPVASPMLETGRMFREMGGGHGVQLPYARETGVTLQEVLNTRRSCRAFRRLSLTVEQLGGVLSLAASAGGNGPPSPKAPGGPPAHRPYPSGGALYPVEILVYPADVRGIAARFYNYQALAHRLVPSAAKADENLKNFLAEDTANEAAFFVLLFLDFTRLSLSKYGKKAYRLALLEAGHLAQNVLLAAAAFRLAALPLCGFDDDRLSRAAGLRYPDQPVVYVLAVGSAAGDADE